MQVVDIQHQTRHRLYPFLHGRRNTNLDTFDNITSNYNNSTNSFNQLDKPYMVLVTPLYGFNHLYGFKHEVHVLYTHMAHMKPLKIKKIKLSW